MEESISLIIRGCQLARDLESNLAYLANHPNILSKSCDEIVNMFMNARERLQLNAQDPSSTSYPSSPSMLLGEALESQPSQILTPLQEWLRSSCPHAMNIRQTQVLGEIISPFNVRGSPETRTGDAASWEYLGLQIPVTELMGRDTEVSARSRRGTVGETSSSQRSRRRKDEADKWTETVPAPRMGNTEIPPEDGYTWRKYGQKEILGFTFPRSYYRCTHQKLYQCPAKKQVQRLDPNTFEVTYRGNHTCHMSATAPSVAPPSSSAQETITTQPPPSASAPPLGSWLSMEIRPTGEAINTLPMYRNFTTLSGQGGSSSSTMIGSDGAGPSSTVRYGREADYPVVDMADVMFNSGSSSTNSMDFIFPSMDDKWDQPDHDKKN